MLNRQTVNVSIEMEEIKKTVANAISQGEKYEIELNKINDDIVEYLHSEQYHNNNGIDLIPDMEQILDKRAMATGEPRFQIGQPVSASWNTNGMSLNPASPLTNGDNCDAISIIEDNEHLRQRYVNVIIICTN